MTAPQGLAHTGARQLAAGIAAKQISARELTECYLERIAKQGGALNAVVALDASRAISAATAVDAAAAAGEALGPLAGVPITVKEAFAVEGLATTAGMAELAGRPASADAPAVALLRQAGAVVLGKTNVPVALADLQSDNPVYGRTSNPWDAERTCGGSSGGSAAAVAAGLSAFDLGSDLGGSIRVPAAWCGVYGLRPSNGWISKRGHLPWPLDGLLEPPMSVCGPIARCVEDLALAFEVLTSTSRASRPALAGLRIGVWTSVPEAPVDAETRHAIDACRAGLEDAGAHTQEMAAPVDAEAVLALGARLMDAEITHGLSDEQWEAAAAGAEGGSFHQLLRHHMADQEQRLATTRAWDAVFDAFDVVMCPAVGIVAPPHDATPRTQRTVRIDGVAFPAAGLNAWSVLTSVAHLPSVTIPVGPGAPSGLPVGVQLVGRFRGDRELLGVAAAIDEVVDGWRIPPGW